MTAVTKTKSKVSFSVVDVVLAVIAAFGVVVGIIRLIQGLGATTNLSSAYPWGMWIAFDVFTIPFAAVAFTFAAVVHILNQEKYHGLSRLTVLAGFLGYLMVVLVLVMDIGRWDQFYSVLLPWRWNLHSFMFEVALSITLYFGVLVLELFSIIFERTGSPVVQWLNRLIVLIAGVGVLLSCVHQSSIGAVFVILRHKLDALWWTPIIPVLFFTSAVFTGLSVAIFLGVVTWRMLGKSPPMHLLKNVAKWAAIAQVIYLVLKFGDLLFAGELGLMFTSGRFSLLFWAELIIGVIVPMIIYFSKSRESENGLLVASACTVVGILLNRWSIAWFALAPPPPMPHAVHAVYFPYWIEWVIAIAAIAAGILIYSLAVRFIPVLRETVTKESH
jgi:Ni/Fe-hydrogenase subunit HybB-like protein